MIDYFQSMVLGEIWHTQYMGIYHENRRNEVPVSATEWPRLNPVDNKVFTAALYLSWGECGQAIILPKMLKSLMAN